MSGEQNKNDSLLLDTLYFGTVTQCGNHELSLAFGKKFRESEVFTKEITK